MAIIFWGHGLFIHSKAHVEDSDVGEGTHIWQFASVIRGARLGRDCNVGSCATVHGAYLGDRCIVSPGAFVVPGTLCGDDVFIGPNVTICNDRWPSTNKEGFFLADEQVTVHLMDGCSIGANAVILPGVIVGKNALISAGAVCTKDVPEGHVLFRDGYTKAKPYNWRERRMIDVDYSFSALGAERA